MPLQAFQTWDKRADKTLKLTYRALIGINRIILSNSAIKPKFCQEHLSTKDKGSLYRKVRVAYALSLAVCTVRETDVKALEVSSRKWLDLNLPYSYNRNIVQGFRPRFHTSPKGVSKRDLDTKTFTDHFHLTTKCRPYFLGLQQATMKQKRPGELHFPEGGEKMTSKSIS